MMTCAEFEILLADYLDEALSGSDQKLAIEAHLSGCAACAELARDAAGAMAFIERSAAVEIPRELPNRILAEMGIRPSPHRVQGTWVRRWFQPVFHSVFQLVFQPRLALGLAMTVISVFLLGRLAGVEVRTVSDLHPVRIWTAAEDRVNRSWERTILYYDSMPLVADIQTQLADWNPEQADDANGTTPGRVETR